MKRFTPGERRGSIMLLAVMTVIATFLIFNKGQHLSAPIQSAGCDDTTLLSSPKQTSDSTNNLNSASHPTHNSKSGKTSSAKKKIGNNAPAGKQRDYLDEGV